MKHKILIAVTLLFFSACMKVKKKVDDAPPSAVQVQQVEQSENEIFTNTRVELEYKYEVSESSDFHQVRFMVPNSWNSEVIVRKVKGTEQSESVATFDSRMEWVDALIPGDKTTYQFFSKVGKEVNLLAEVEVLPVLDINVEDEDVNLAQLYKLNSKTKMIHIRNLIIQSQKHLFIEDFSGTIIIDHLKTNNGFIQTFPIDGRAADDQIGKSGGQVNLVIKDGEGQLVMLMKGQNGGNGSSAKEPDASLIGAKGARAQEAQFTQTGEVGPLGLSLGYRCFKAPGESNYGGNGKRGYQGYNGKNGGNSGSISIFSKNQNLEISLNNLSGSGGKLSQGGVGGEGGEPGDSADGAQQDLDIWLVKSGSPLDPTTRKSVIEGFVTAACSPSTKKEKGRLGPDGYPGANNGEAGIRQPSYINLERQP